MVKKEPLIIFFLIGLVGYVTFHGHRVNQDCFLCPWRGLVFLGSSGGLGAYLAYSDD